MDSIFSRYVNKDLHKVLVSTFLLHGPYFPLKIAHWNWELHVENHMWDELLVISIYCVLFFFQFDMDKIKEKLLKVGELLTI